MYGPVRVGAPGQYWPGLQSEAAQSARSPEIEYPQRPDCPRLFLIRMPGSARSEELAYIIERQGVHRVARRLPWHLSAAELPGYVSMPDSKTRSARRLSRYFSTRPMLMSGFRRYRRQYLLLPIFQDQGLSRYRMATIGSSTEPSLSESADDSFSLLRITDSIAAAYKFHAVGLIGYFSNVRTVDNHYVKHP